MPTTNITGIFLIIIKIFFCQEAVFISDQTITLHFSSIKLYLQFYIFCYRK